MVPQAFDLSSVSLNPAIAALALGIEACLGYPRALDHVIGHPVVWMGRLLAGLDRWLNREGDGAGHRRALGGVALFLLLLVTGTGALLVQTLGGAVPPILLRLPLLGLLASPCLAQRSLDQHVADVATALALGGLDAGRRAVAMIVGRDTMALDESGVARAAIESLAENFSDGIVAPALYVALLGLPGGYLYKAINTADSMIGHRTPRHAAFGFAAAKLDDAINWPAARLAAFWIVVAAALVRNASPVEAWRVMRRDARGHPSPNAGWPEAAMAGALGIRLGGPRSYGGRLVEDATMGDGRGATPSDIRRALTLYRLACLLNAGAILGLALLVAAVLSARGR